MKGVILNFAPHARIIDITHEIPAFSIPAAAFINDWSFRYFPIGSIHVCVVDPGVGTSRRILIVEACGHYFTAPDNGLLTPLFDQDKVRIFAAENNNYWMDKISHTFHGRDIFSPLAAWLAKGVPPSEMGQIIHDPVCLLFKPLTITEKSIECHVRYIDTFGNVITSLDYNTFLQWITSAGAHPEQVSIHWIEYSIQGISKTYGDKSLGEVVAVFDGFDRLEIAIHGGNAHEKTRLNYNDPVFLTI